MNKFINKILKEASKYDDPFFQSKTKKRNEELERRREEFIHKIKLGLQNIKTDYKNENWESKEEKLFLTFFSEFHLHEEYDKKHKTYFLKNEKNENICKFDLKYYSLSTSYQYFWSILEKRFHLNFDEILSFIKDMLKKHFKLDEFASGGCFLS